MSPPTPIRRAVLLTDAEISIVQMSLADSAEWYEKHASGHEGMSRMAAERRALKAEIDSCERIDFDYATPPPADAFVRIRASASRVNECILAAHQALNASREARAKLDAVCIKARTP